jgi:hypothetical protein
MGVKGVCEEWRGTLTSGAFLISVASREQTIMNQRDIEAAQRLIAQFEGGSGRHNSNQTIRSIARLQADRRISVVIKPSFKECEIGECCETVPYRVPDGCPRVKLKDSFPSLYFTSILLESYESKVSVVTFERILVYSFETGHRQIWKRVD